MKELDGGQLDMPELSCMKAVLQICDDNDLDSTSLRHAPMSMIETLQEAAYQQMQAETSQMTASSQLRVFCKGSLGSGTQVRNIDADHRAGQSGAVQRKARKGSSGRFDAAG